MGNIIYVSLFGVSFLFAFNDLTKAAPRLKTRLTTRSGYKSRSSLVPMTGKGDVTLNWRVLHAQHV